MIGNLGHFLPLRWLGKSVPEFTSNSDYYNR